MNIDFLAQGCRMALAVLYSIEAVKLSEVLGGYVADQWRDQMASLKKLDQLIPDNKLSPVKYKSFDYKIAWSAWSAVLANLCWRFIAFLIAGKAINIAMIGSPQVAFVIAMFPVPLQCHYASISRQSLKLFTAACLLSISEYF